MNKFFLHSSFWSLTNSSSSLDSWKNRKMKFAMKNFLVILISAVTFFSATSQVQIPTIAAPDPICDPADVISMYSNSYTDVPVDTWLTPWSPPATTLTDLQIGGNDTKLYENVDFLGIEMFGTPIDASGMTYFNVDVWTSNMTTFRVKLVDFSGPITEGEIAFTPTQSGWNTFSIPMADFADPTLVTGPTLQNTTQLSQLIFSGLPTGSGSFYVDNIYFSTSACPTAAPEPTCDAANVISMFSNSYTDVPVDTWLTPWSPPATTLTDLQIGGNDTKLYENVDFLGIEMFGTPIDASAMTTFNVDVWTSNMTTFRVKLVDFSGPQTEGEIAFTPTQLGWNTFAIPLADFANPALVTNPALTLQNTTQLSQLIFSGLPTGSGSFYVDNIYFSTCTPPPTGVDVEFCVDLSCFPGNPQVPSVGGTFTTPPFNFGQYFLADPDLDGIWCATVSLAPGNYEYRFFDQIEGQEALNPADPCVNAAANRTLMVQAGMPQNLLFGWETCDPTCIPPLPPPDLPLIFDDQALVDYNLISFAGMNSVIGVDPTNSANAVLCSTKGIGAACFAGTVVGDAGLLNPVPFTANSTVMTMDVYSPNVGTPILLKVENSANGGIASEVLAFTTVANTWETLVFNFANGTPAINLALTYDKVVVFANFTCTGPGDGLGLTYYFDNIQMCELPLAGITCPDDISGLACNAPVPPAATNDASFLALGGTIDNPCLNPVTVSSVDVVSGDDCVGITITRTYTVSDGSETVTCDQIIAFDPPPPPVITCPADQSVTCIDDFVVDPNTATATSLCGNIVAIYVKNPLISGVPGCDGTTYTYIYVAVDDCGRSSECEQQVIIQNSVLSSINVPAGGTVECFEDIDISIDDATVNTGCASYNLYLVPPTVNGELGCPGATYTYTYRLIDACGNTVEEDVVFTNGSNAAPTITAPADLTTDCLASLNPNPDNAIVTTSCSTGSVVTVSGPVIVGPVDCNNTIYRYTYTVTDDCGRSASDIQQFKVVNGPPVFENCPGDNWLVLNCEDYGGEGGTIQVIEAWIASVTASTSCGLPLTVFNNFNSNNINTCVNNGYNTVTFRATDACGRTSFCTGVYVVVDTEAPVITTEAQDHWEVCNYNSQANLTAWVQSRGGAEAYDGCSNTNISWQASPANPQINCIGATGTTSVTVQFIVTDNCGNKTTTSATFNTLVSPDGNLIGQGEDQLKEERGLTLLQNRPNPFKDETVISFSLPTNTEATLTIFDMNGRVLKVVNGTYAKGLNEVSINRSDLGGSGVKYYTLSTQNETATKIMVVID
jgi:hypothetical protein